MWEQLTYTSADYVENGMETSGWHFSNRSDGMDETKIAQLREFMRSTLQVTAPLPGFPSEEELRTAEVRLCLRQSQWGPVLVHTAQAGKDTTNRTNTFTHVALFTGTTDAPGFLPAQAWRAPWWLTPVGAAAVRSAQLPEQSALGAGPVVTMEAIKAWIATPSHKDTLIRLSEALAHVWEHKQDQGDAPSDSPLVVVGVETCDEAAMWIAALGRLCAPTTAWSFNWSTWEVPNIASEVDRLRREGFDMVFVPRQRLQVVPDTDGYIAIDSAGQEIIDPTSTWGLLVDGLLSDDEVLHQAQFLIDDVNASIPWGVVPAPGWLLSAVEVFDEGTLTCGDEMVERRVTAELVATDLRILDEDEELAHDASARVADTSLNEAWEWGELLDRLPAGTVQTPLVQAVASRYLLAASLEERMLLGTEERSARRRELVGAWLASQEGSAQVPSLLDRVAQTLGPEYKRGKGAPAVNLFALEWFIREGAPDLSEGEIAKLPAELTQFILYIHRMGDAEELQENQEALAQILQTDPSAQTLARIQRSVEQSLEAMGPPQLPAISADVVAWLTRHSVGGTLPRINAEAALVNFWKTQSESGAHQVLDSLAALPPGWRIDAAYDQALKPFVGAGRLMAAPWSTVEGLPHATVTAIITDAEGPEVANLLASIQDKAFQGEVRDKSLAALATVANHAGTLASPEMPLHPTVQQCEVAWRQLHDLIELEKREIVSPDLLAPWAYQYLRPAVIVILAAVCAKRLQESHWPASPTLTLIARRLVREKPNAALAGVSRKASKNEPPRLSDLMLEVLTQLVVVTDQRTNRRPQLGVAQMAEPEAQDGVISAASWELMVALLRDIMANFDSQALEAVVSRLHATYPAEDAILRVMEHVRPVNAIRGFLRG